MNYASFQKAVANKGVPEKNANQTFEEVTSLNLDCWLLICAFVANRAYIFKTGGDGSFEACENFAAIGSGTLIAEGAFYQREHDSNLPVSHALYHVFEAMKVGSIAPGVGKEHTIDILYPPGEKSDEVYSEVLSTKGISFMEQQFAKLGPKKFLRFARLPKGTLEKDFD